MCINARFPMQLTRALLPKVSRPDVPTLIMNLGSLSDQGVPYVTVYGGSKAFNMWKIASLAIEVKIEGKDIEVLAIPVGRVTDVAHNKESSPFFTPTTRVMAKPA